MPRTLPRQRAPSLWISTVFSATTSVGSARPTRPVHEYPCVLHLQSLRGSLHGPHGHHLAPDCLDVCNIRRCLPKLRLMDLDHIVPRWNLWNLQKLENGSTNHINHPLCRLRVGKRGWHVLVHGSKCRIRVRNCGCHVLNHGRGRHLARWTCLHALQSVRRDLHNGICDA